MLPYIIVLLMVMLFALIAENVKTKSEIIYNFYRLLILLVLTLFAGFRNLRVGSDTRGYVHRFEDLNIDFLTFIKLESNTEIGYRLLEYITSLFSNDYMLILIVIALVALYFQLKSIYKLSEQPVISIFIFITIGIYTFVFNGARQGIAAAIYMFALTFLINAKFWKYVLWVFIASLFHKSVIIGIPLYFLFRKEFTKKWFIFLLIGSVLSIYFFGLLLNFSSLINERYSTYQEMGVQGGIYLTLAYVLLSGFFILIRSKINPLYKVNYDIYLNMFLFGTIIYIVVYFSGAYIEITRMAFFYILSTIFIWPLIFKSMKQKEIALVFVFFVLVHIFFYYIFIGKMAGLNPYILNSKFD